MIRIKRLNYRQLLNNFGDPATYEGQKQIRKAIVEVRAPFILQPRNSKVVRCHEYCADAYYHTLCDILDYYGHELLEQYNLNQFAGCWMIRKIRGNDDWWSIHSWGMAFDHNPNLGRPGIPSIMPYLFVDAFVKHGFGWGGLWKKQQDGMHFSVTGT